MAVVFDYWCADLMCALCGLFLFIYIYFKYIFTYWKKKGVTYLEPYFPYGNVKETVFQKKNISEVIANICNEFPNEKVVGAYLMFQPFLIVKDLTLLKDVLVKDFANFHDRGMRVNPEADPILNHLFLSTGQHWRNLRAKLSPTFTSGKMKMMFHTLLECAEELKAHLQEPAMLGEDIEIKDILARFTTDVISSCAFGIQCNCLKDPDAEFRKYGIKSLKSGVKSAIASFVYVLMPRIGCLLKLRIMSSDVVEFFFKIVRETIEYREKNGVERKDFMQLLIRLKNTGYVDIDSSTPPNTNGDPELQKLTMDEITANAFVFFLAGFETSSTTMSFCLYELACNPSIQDRLRQEIDFILKKHGAFTYEAMQEMNYLDMVVSETLRKYPPVMHLNRECAKNYRMSNSDVEIDAGGMVIVPVLAIHRDPQYYPEPLVFDPERFTEEAKASRPHFAYLPFGDGPRNCIGLRFGLMQTKVGIITLISQFQFDVCDKTSTPLVIDPKVFVMSSVGGIFLRISKRSPS